MKQLLATATILVFQTIIGLSSVQADASVPFTILLQRNFALHCHHERGLETARTAEELTGIWSSICLPVPDNDVDFRRDMVIVYFMGPQPMIGPKPEIVAIHRAEGLLTVEVVDHIGRGGFDAPSDPFVMVTVHKWPGRIVLDRREEPGSH